jgi:hypothetical protein
MKSFFAATLVVICVSGTVTAADRQLVGLMMPDAKVLGGVNVAQVRSSPFGAYLLAQFPITHPQFQQFVDATGFNPLLDITEVVAASLGVPGDKSGLAAVRGNFDIARIVSFAQTVGATVDRSQGVTVIGSPDDQMSIALLDPTLAIAGDTNDVIAAIARKSAPSTLDPVLMVKATALSGSQDAWAVTTVAPGAAGIGPGAPAGLNLNLTALENIQQSSAGVKFGTSANVTAEVVADTAQNATSLADVVRMVVALGQMNQGDPQAAQFADLLKSLTVQTKGTALELSISIPEDILEQLSPASRRPAVRKVVERQK